MNERKKFADRNVTELIDLIDVTRSSLQAVREDWEDDTQMMGLITSALNRLIGSKSDLEDILRKFNSRVRRYTRCHCCGASFYTYKPQDPERDIGFGTCLDCHERVAKSWVLHGFPGERHITMEQALERLRKYA